MGPLSVEIDVALVKRLLAEQVPEWADLPLAPVASAGTDNALFRLGGDRVVRLPRVNWAAGQATKEHAWLPRLAPALPMALPVPLFLGVPGEGYPWNWTVCRWLEGRDGVAAAITDQTHAATTLAGLIRALQGIDTTDGPLSGRINNYRGVALARLDTVVREALSKLTGEIDVAAAATVWEVALAAPVWDRPGVWLHGDLHPGNLLVAEGRLSAVIDFGLLAVGDPACDLMVAWSVLDHGSRPLFRAGLTIDNATWTRGRGWALYVSSIALAHYLTSDPTLAAISRRTLGQVLADQA
ncbi:MAG: aminoglycoside phosphotransferase family protein [Caulobacter sp.]